MDEQEIRSIVQDAVSEAVSGSDSPSLSDPQDSGVDSKLNELRRERSEVLDRVEELREKVESEDKELTEEEREELDDLADKAESLADQIQLAKTEQRASSATIPEEGSDSESKYVDVDPNAAPRDSQKYKQIFRKWAVGGMSNLSMREQEIMRTHRERRVSRMGSKAQNQVEERRLTTQTTSAGGALVPEEMENSLTAALDSTGSVLEAPVNDFTTETGRTMQMPQWDDTSNKGSIIKEDGTYSKTDPSTSKQKLDAFLYTSDEIEVSVTELTDTIVSDMESRLGEALGKRIARKRNELQTTGQGGNEPRGLTVASTKGTDSNSAGTLEYVDFKDLEAALPQIFFQEDFQLHLMFNRKTLGAIKNITDDNSNPIFFDPESNNIESRKTVFGYPYVVNEDMPDIGSSSSGNNAVLFGAFERYNVRTVEGVMVHRVPLEAKLAADQRRAVGFVAFVEGDADLNNPGDDPIKHINIS